MKTFDHILDSLTRHDNTIEFQHLDNKLFGSIHTYVKVEENARKHSVTIKNNLAICPPITLLLWKFSTKLMTSYPDTETGLSLTTSLE